METGKRNHVNGQLAEISVQLTGESETGSDSGHGGRDKMVEVTISWSGQLKGAEADVVQSFVVDAEGLVGVLHELMDGQCGVVRFYDGVGNLWRWDDTESGHDAVRILLSDLGD
jgi:hypothetical protein